MLFIQNPLRLAAAGFLYSPPKKEAEPECGPAELVEQLYNFLQGIEVLLCAHKAKYNISQNATFRRYLSIRLHKYMTLNFLPTNGQLR
jgi:hypothetical protein